MWINFQGYHTIFFLIQKHIKYFIYHFFEIILIIVKGTSLYVFQVRMDTITFPFYYECNFFLLSTCIYLFSDYFSGIFFHFLCKGILSLSFINYRFIYISMFTQARQTSVDGAVTEKWKYHNQYSTEMRYWFAVHCFPG